MSSQFSRGAHGNDVKMTGGDMTHEQSKTKGQLGMVERDIDGVRVPILKDISLCQVYIGVLKTQQAILLKRKS